MEEVHCTRTFGNKSIKEGGGRTVQPQNAAAAYRSSAPRGLFIGVTSAVWAEEATPVTALAATKVAAVVAMAAACGEK